MVKVSNGIGGDLRKAIISAVVVAIILGVPTAVYTMFSKNEAIKKIEVIDKRSTANSEKIIQNTANDKLNKELLRKDVKYLHSDVKRLMRKFDKVFEKEK